MTYEKRRTSGPGDDEGVRTDGGEVGTEERLQETRDPSNYEFGETPHGEKVHVVGTGLPTSMLVRGRQVEGTAGADAERALCGTVSEFDLLDEEEVPTDPSGTFEFCRSCARQASAKRLLGRGKFEAVPL